MQKLEDLIADLISGDDQKAESSVMPLARLGEFALERLLVLLKDEDPDHRWWAARALAAFEDELACEGLRQALSDPIQYVRHCAALGLRYSPSCHPVPELAKALASEDRLLARLAGDALIAVGEAAIPALSEALHSTNAALRAEAARALAKMDDPEIIPILFSAAEDPSPIVQHWIEEGFERLGVGMVFFKP
jgi:HEAT repeat protein